MTKYYNGQRLYISAKYQDGYAKLGEGFKSWVVPIDACVVEWAEQKTPKIGNIVSVNGLAYKDTLFQLIGIDGKFGWVKPKDSDLRFDRFNIDLADLTFVSE